MAFGAVALLAAVLIAGCGGNSGPIPGAVGQFTGPTTVGGTGTTVDLSAFLAPGQAGASRVGKTVCGGCHGPARSADSPRATDDDVDKLTSFDKTKHAKVGIECEDCHGPGSKHVDGGAAERKNTIITMPTVISASICGQCHSDVVRQAGGSLDQYDEWVASKHDSVVASAVSGTNRYSTCMNCHTDWKRVKELEEGQPLTEEEIATIVEHAEEAEQGHGPYHSASCVVCHDPHGMNPANALSDGSNPQLRHKAKQVLTASNYNTSVIGPGTSPATYSSFDHVCAECHNARGVDASDEALGRSTARPGMHDSNQFNMLVGFGGSEADLAVPNDRRHMAHRDVADQCVTCHMSQGHAMVAGNQGCSGTGGCHAASQVAALKTAFQASISDGVSALQIRMNAWGKANSIDGKGATSWQYSSSSYGGPSDQAAVPIQIKRARHNYYFILRDLSKGVHNPIYTRYLLQQANDQLDQLGVARARAADVARARFDLEAASHSSAGDE